MKLQHFVLTRFSLKTSWSWETFPLEWLESRLVLFEEYCLPSLAAQSATDFRWLVYCDESTDESCLARLRDMREICPQLELTITGPRRHPIRLIGSLIEPDTDVLLTTRIDSDDAMHVDMLAAVQEYAEPFADSRHEELLINFPRGYKLDAAAGRAYHSYMDNSPFHSLAERPGPRPQSVMSGNHSLLHQKYPTHQDHSIPGWLQVVYGGNIRNNITNRDIPTDAEPLPRLFGIHPGLKRAPSATRPPAATPERA
jgi:hypothetical protein